MISTIAALSLAYAVLGVLLLAMLLRARFDWRVKAATIVATSAFFIVAFEETRGLLGWPGSGALPPHFQLLWSRVVEPSKAAGDPGAIYLWVETLDDNNIPSGVPRSFKLRYTRPLADKTDQAKEAIIAGKPIEGEANDMDDASGDTAPNGQRQTAEQAATDADISHETSPPVDSAFLQDAPKHLDFAPLHPPLLPAK